MKGGDKIILGIDPGTVILGFGLIKVSGQQLSLLECDVIKPGKYAEQAERLKLIFDEVNGIIKKYAPNELAIEAPFYGKNVQSMLKLGRAQGVAIAAALQHNLTVNEYSPKKVKQSITGNGNASKEQVAAMLQNLLHFKQTPEFLDATDALGVAVCHHFQNRGLAGEKKNYKGWEAYMAANPGRKITK